MAGRIVKGDRKVFANDPFQIQNNKRVPEDVARSIGRLMPLISLMQLPENPARSELGIREANYAWILQTSTVCVVPDASDVKGIPKPAVLPGWLG
jgi:hypothetical protein